ncbi:hypothetical protein MRBBS_2902 [Marinobacter sp. BSs20148]|nr:hypothetical protein MRBBS_2902 [Marinobacter sp. BSs20148]
MFRSGSLAYRAALLQSFCHFLPPKKDKLACEFLFYSENFFAVLGRMRER